MPNFNLSASARPDEPLRSTLRSLFHSDREWLLAHPNETLTRDVVPGEFWPNSEHELPGRDLVRQVEVHLDWFLGEKRGPIRLRTPVGDFDWSVSDGEDSVAWQLRSDS
jgi:hypothetical protein